MKSVTRSENEKICPICGGDVYVPNPPIWGYIRVQNMRKDQCKHILYFCSHSCLREYDRRHEAELRESKKKAVQKRMTKLKNKRKPKERPDLEEVCGDCQFCGKTKFGFYDCGYYDYAVNAYKVACGKFIPKEGVEYG